MLLRRARGESALFGKNSFSRLRGIDGAFPVHFVRRCGELGRRRRNRPGVLRDSIAVVSKEPIFPEIVATQVKMDCLRIGDKLKASGRPVVISAA